MTYCISSKIVKDFFSKNKYSSMQEKVTLLNLIENFLQDATHVSLWPVWPYTVTVFGKQKKDGFAAPARKDPGRPKWRRPFSHTEKQVWREGEVTRTRKRCIFPSVLLLKWIIYSITMFLKNAAAIFFSGNTAAFRRHISKYSHSVCAMPFKNKIRSL